MDVTKKQLDKIKEARKQKFLDDCGRRLSNIAESKMKTTFIGSLDIFEKEFGDLWGAGIPEEEKTNEEQEWFEIWQNVRTAILNNGNNQMRALLNEISNHVVKWNRYSMTFINKDMLGD